MLVDMDTVQFVFYEVYTVFSSMSDRILRVDMVRRVCGVNSFLISP